jgi:hypothetical protein
MRRRIEELPQALQYEEANLRKDFWHAFLALEHEARQTIHGKRDFLLGDAAPGSKDEIGYDEEGEDDKMEDVPPAIVKLETLVPDDYDEEAAMVAALVASKADEESKWWRSTLPQSARFWFWN